MLQVKAGICCAHLQADRQSNHGLEEAQQYFSNLLQEPLAESVDLCLTVAEELLQLEHADEVAASLLCAVSCTSAGNSVSASMPRVLLQLLLRPLVLAIVVAFCTQRVLF